MVHNYFSNWQYEFDRHIFTNICKAVVLHLPCVTEENYLSRILIFIFLWPYSTADVCWSGTQSILWRTRKINEFTTDNEPMANSSVIGAVLGFGLLQKSQGSDSAPLFSIIHTLKYYSFSVKCQLDMLVSRLVTLKWTKNYIFIKIFFCQIIKIVARSNGNL